MIDMEAPTDKIKNEHSSYSILFFDGVCNLCNASVDFVVSKDRNRKFRYAPLQSETAKKVLGNTSINLENPSSFVLYHQGTILRKSSAALKVAQLLGFPLSLVSVFFIIPKFIRDWVYSVIADNRYKWFGKKETCRLPTESERELFLD